MTSNLIELKAKLYEAFDGALRRKDSSAVSAHQEAGFYQAAGAIAQAIVAVETRLDERERLNDGFKCGLG